MLWQLREAGKLDGVRGIVFGEMLDCTSPGAPPELLEEVILRAFDRLRRPHRHRAAQRATFRAQNVTLTFGVEAELLAAERGAVATDRAGGERDMTLAWDDLRGTFI